MRRIELAVDIIGQAAPGALTDISGGTVTPSALGQSRIRLWVTCAFQNATTFLASITNGGTTVDLELNGGANLEADALYTFEIPVTFGDSIDWQIGTDGIIRRLIVQTVYDGGDA